MPDQSIQLVDYWVNKLVVESRLSELPEEAFEELTVQGATPRVKWGVFSGTLHREFGRFWVKMEIGFGEPGSTVTSGLIELEGCFDIDTSIAEKRAADLANITAPTILYGTARGLIGAVTAIVAGGKFILPPLSADELLDARSRSMSRPRARKQPRAHKPTPKPRGRERARDPRR